jgi:hypothetical protein
VTVEVNPSGRDWISGEKLQAAGERGRLLWDKYKAEGTDLHAFVKKEAPDLYEQIMRPDIVQIKGKQNKAPTEDYLPFVRDFVRSGKWGNVADLGNAGLLKVGPRYMTPEEAAPFRRYRWRADDSMTPEYISEDEWVKRVLVEPSLNEQGVRRTLRDRKAPNFVRYEVPDDWKPQGFAKGGMVLPEVDAALSEAESQSGLPSGLLHALAEVESGKNPKAVGKKGEIGLMQFMPRTAKWLGIDPADPAQAAQGAARYLKYLVQRFGTIDRALAAYNWGEGNMARDEKKMPASTRNYVGRILERLIGRPEAAAHKAGLPAEANLPVSASIGSPAKKAAADLTEDKDYKDAMAMLDRILAGDPGSEDFLASVLFDPAEDVA